MLSHRFRTPLLFFTMIALARCEPARLPAADAARDVADAASDMSAPDATAREDASVDSEVARDSTSDSAGDSTSDAAIDADSASPSTDAATDAREAGLCFVPTAALSLPSGTLSGTLRGDLPSLNDSVTCSPSDTSGTDEQFYSFSLTSRTGVEFIVTSVMPRAMPVLAIRDACGRVSSELFCDRGGPDDSGLGHLRAVLEPGDYTLLVDNRVPFGGPYELSYSTFTPAANASCAGALPLVAGVRTIGDTADGGRAMLSCAPSIAGGAVYYYFDIPAQSGVALSLEALSDAPMFGALLDNCADRRCLNSVPFSMARPALPITATNPAPLPRRVYLAVSTASADAHSSFALTATVSPIPAGSVCSSPISLALDESRTDDSWYGGESLSCAPEQQPARFYTLRVPAMSRAIATLSAVARGTIVRKLDACAPAQCPVSLSRRTGEPQASLTLNNSTATARDVVLAVSSLTAETARYQLRYDSVAALAANAACSGAVPISPGAAPISVDTRAGGDPIGCRLNEGEALYYSVTIPANSHATARISPSGAIPATLRLLDSCAATSCLRTAETPASGDEARSVQLVNPTGVDKTFILAVGSPTRGAAASAALDVSAPVANRYTVEVRDGVLCEPLPIPATPVPNVTNDDSISPSIALEPTFAFRYFGDPVSAMVVSSNGFIGFGAVPTSASTNLGIPNSAPPNGTVALFWDDLAPMWRSAMRSALHYGYAGSAPNRRLIVHWDNWLFFSTTTPPADAHLTFQASFHEGSGVIEFTYCTIAADPTEDARARGDSATIGLESVDGMDGVEVSRDEVDTIRTGRRYRFVPR